MIGWLDINESIIPQYEKMKSEKCKIFIWGIGALAISAAEYCKYHTVSYEGFVVDKEFKFSEEFLGKRVITWEELDKEVFQYAIVVGHASYKMAIDRLKDNKKVSEVYCLAGLSYDVRYPISKEFIERYESEIERLYDIVADDLSRKCLKAFYESRINDDASYMFSCWDKKEGYYNNSIFKLTQEEVLLDVGACVGNSLWPFIDAVEEKYKKIIAVEPEKDNYNILQQNIKNKGIERIVVQQVCAYSEDKTVAFFGNGERGGIVNSDENTQVYPAKKIDTICRELEVFEDISLIKINFPFALVEVLQGAREVLKASKPKLIIRIGFWEKEMIDACLKLMEINPNYNLYFRYTVGIPQGLTLFAI